MCLTADHCHSYWDTNGVFHDTQECGKYCCGDCRTKYCCSDIKYSFTEKKQELCFRRCALHFSLIPPQCSRNEYKLQLLFCICRSARVKRSYHAEYVGIGVPVPILVCTGLIICCVTRCCSCCRTSKKKNPSREIISKFATAASSHTGILSRSILFEIMFNSYNGKWLFDELYVLELFPIGMVAYRNS